MRTLYNIYDICFAYPEHSEERERIVYIYFQYHFPCFVLFGGGVFLFAYPGQARDKVVINILIIEFSLIITLHVDMYFFIFSD